jgi:hypothetical protein
MARHLIDAHMGELYRYWDGFRCVCGWTVLYYWSDKLGYDWLHGHLVEVTDMYQHMMERFK